MTGPGEGAADVVSFSADDRVNATKRIANASVWSVDSIWVEKEALQ